MYAHAIQATNYPPSGELVYLLDQKRPFAIAYFNANTQLMARVLTLDIKAKIDEAFFFKRFSKALAKRERLIPVPYYRLVHAEGDSLPGLVIDRFGDKLVVQTSTLGMEKLKPIWLPVLKSLLSPAEIIFRNDIPHRELEGLPLTVEQTEIPLAIPVIENQVTFFAAPVEGQKTGWFYDQRANRKWVAKNAKGKTLLDMYTYSGGFGITAQVNGAIHTTLVDSSEKSLQLAMRAAEENNVSNHCTFVRAKVFDYLETLIQEGKTFEFVVVDPPAFIKNSKDIKPGLRGYEKLAKLAAQVVAPNGTLFIASCSHHASVDDFHQSVLKGIEKAERTPELLYKGGADKDHPIHPMLPENHYLKAFAFQLS